MAQFSTARTVIGVIGNIISCGLFLSPVPAFWQMVQWKDTRGFSGFPYAMTILNCLLWVLYGLPFVHPNSILVLSVNSFGLLMETLYIAIFLTFCRDKELKVKTAGVVTLNVTFFTLLAALTLGLTHTQNKRSTTVGTVCIVFSVVMYASPLSIMRKVIKERSVKYMPFWLSLACTCNGAVWTTYGCLPFDRNLVVSNGLGTFLGICQLTLYGCYYSSTNWEDNNAKRNEQPHLGETEIDHRTTEDL